MRALPNLRRLAPFAAAAVAALWAAAAFGETSAPTATTATYGAWTLGCAMVVPGSGGAAVKLCQMTTQLNLKGQDGQLRPLLQVSIGTPPGAKVARLALQVPTDVALRDGVVISLDQPGAAGADPAAVEPGAAKPQTPVLTLAYLTCTPQGCVADADAGAEVFDALKGQTAANVTFTSLQGGKKIVVPVSLDGFADAFAALKTAGK